MTNALSCYVRDKLPPCSLFLLILKIVLTFFPLPMNHWIELRGRRLIRAVHYWKYRLFFRKGKKVSLSFETGERGLIIVSCHVTPQGKGDSFVAII